MEVYDMKKKMYLSAMIAVFSMAVSTVPAWASDAPTDDGNYIWQDENGDYWYRNGSEDEYIGEGNYAPDPDTGELMEANDAGWTEQDGYFEPHYFYDENGDVWWENDTEKVYIGSGDEYYIDVDNGTLHEKNESSGEEGRTTDDSCGSPEDSGNSDASGNSADNSSGSDNSGNSSSSSDASSDDTGNNSDNTSSQSENTSDDSDASTRSTSSGELYMTYDFQTDQPVISSMPDYKTGYSESRTINDGKTTIFTVKYPRQESGDVLSGEDFLNEFYSTQNGIDSQEETTIASYPAVKYHYQSSVNEEPRTVDALVCATDDYSFGIFALTPSGDYDDAAAKAADELFTSADLIYAERIDMALTDYFQVLTPEKWKYLCHYETKETDQGGYTLTYYCEDVPVLTLEARYYDGTDQPLDSVWQQYLGRIETPDDKKYDLLATISQYSEDASDDWKTMYDSCNDVINGILIMDQCVLTSGSHL